MVRRAVRPRMGRELMSTSQIIWTIVIIVVVIAIIAIIAAMMKKRTLEKHRAEADEIRTDASTHANALPDAQLRAREADAEAERKRVEAERAEARADEEKQGMLREQATYEDRVREADRVDPDVDHEAADYRPQAPGVTDTDATGTTGTDSTDSTGTTDSTDSTGTAGSHRA
jgi:FtsZ-interacting cell division protein ZipA